MFVKDDDRHGEGTALNNLGNALCSTGRFQEAIEAYTLSVATLAETGDRSRERAVAQNLERAFKKQAIAGGATKLGSLISATTGRSSIVRSSG